VKTPFLANRARPPRSHEVVQPEGGKGGGLAPRDNRKAAMDEKRAVSRLLEEEKRGGKKTC